jgi:hypothetical protein
MVPFGESHTAPDMLVQCTSQRFLFRRTLLELKLFHSLLIWRDCCTLYPDGVLLDCLSRI